MTHVAFIGLGNMGAPMAENLLKAGYTLSAHDLNEVAVRRLVELGGRAAPSAYDAATGADIVITMLPNGAIVEAVYLGSGGLIECLAHRPLLIDSSTVAPETARTLSSAAKARGYAMLDAPVSGGPKGAREGTLSFMVGGDPEAFADAQPVLRAMGRAIFHAGDSGAGQVAKICNNMLAAILMAGTAEALALGVGNGLDPAALSDIFKRSSGNNFMLDRWNPWPGVIEDAPASNAFQGGFQTRLMLKDLGLALANAQAREASVPLGALVRNLFSLHAAAAQENGLQDFSSIQRFYAPSLNHQA